MFPKHKTRVRFPVDAFLFFFLFSLSYSSFIWTFHSLSSCLFTLTLFFSSIRHFSSIFIIFNPFVPNFSPFSSTMDIQTILSQLKQLTTNLETVSAQISDNKSNPQVSSSDSLLLNRTSSASNLPNADNQTSDVLTLKNQILRLQTELNDLSKERDMWRDKYKELSGQGCISDSDVSLYPLFSLSLDSYQIDTPAVDRHKKQIHYKQIHLLITHVFSPFSSHSLVRMKTNASRLLMEQSSRPPILYFLFSQFISSPKHQSYCLGTNHPKRVSLSRRKMIPSPNPFSSKYSLPFSLIP